MRRILIVLLSVCLALSAFTLASCDNVGTDEDKPIIVCSIFPIYDFVSEIVGDSATVILLQKDGVDMHSFEPTARNILDIAHADVLVTLGGESDTWVEGTLRSAENESIRIFEIFSYCELLCEETPDSMRDEHHDHDHDHGEGEIYDEHVWMSLHNAISIVGGLAIDLAGAFPELSEEFAINSAKYTAKLEALAKDFESLEIEDKPFIVADRFPFLYLAHELDLDYLGAFPGCSSETHASFETLVYMINEVKERDADCIFITDGSSLGIAERISEETGAKIYILNSIQSISDAQMKAGVGYLELMRSNYEILVEAYK